MNVARLSLSMANSIREVRAAVTRTWTMPILAPLAVAAREAGVAYATAAREQRAAAPPFVYIFAALVLSALSSDLLSPDQRAALEVCASSCDSPNQLLGHVQICKLSRCWDRSSARLEICVGDKLRSVLDALASLIAAQGGQERFGPAPRGPLERAVQEHVAPREQRLSTFMPLRTES